MGSTIHDVARLADVSISTVSRVLNKTSPVAEDKRKRVEDAARQLRYSPNPAAVSLLKGTTGGIGVLLPAIAGEFFSELLYGFDAAVQKHNQILLVSPSHRNQEELEASLRRIVPRVDGLIIMATGLDTSILSSILPENLPVVFVDTPVESPAANYLNFDNFAGMNVLAAHVLEFGHASIAFVRGPEGSSDADKRLEGFRAAVASCGREVEVTELAGDFSLESGYDAAKILLESDQLPTAVIAANDQSAQGVLRGLREAGVAVPAEIALAGFDGIPSTQYMTPPLTTISVPVRSMGMKALDHLVSLIDKETDELLRESFPLELVIRESTTGYEGHSK